MQARVIHTASQTFLESNIQHVLAIILNASSDNIFGEVSFPEEGGFIYLRGETATKNSTSIILKDKDGVKTGLNNFFTDKNKRIKEYFSNQKGDGLQTPFFPTQYLDFVSVTPHLDKIKNETQLTSWTALYKLKIPPFGGNESGRTKYTSLLNVDLIIKIRVDGVIEEIRYNFLPLEQFQYLALGDPTENESKNENENEISDLVYIFNKDKRVIAPFWLSLTEQPFIPATRSSVLPESLNGFSTNKNSIEFDENRVVMWLQKVGLDRKLEIKDATFTEDNKSNNITLPVGAKVIRLKPKNINDANTPCLFWWKGKYHQSSIPEKNLSISNDKVSKYTSDILNNEIDHLKKRISVYTDKDEQFDVIVKKFTENNRISINKKQIRNKISLLNSRLKIDRNNKPDTIKRLTNEIFSVYNPLSQNGTKFSEETLVIPLTEKWFSGDTKLMKSYKKVWVDNGFSLTIGESGEGIDVDFIDVFIEELIELKNIVNETSQKNTPEATWLKNLNIEDLKSGRINRLISIFDLTWEHDVFDKYSSHIALELSFGPFRIPQLLTVLIHEFSVNSNNFGDAVKGRGRDTHIGREKTEAAWNDLNVKGSSILELAETENDIYQSHAIHYMIGVAIIRNITQL
ncbi:MAG: hypothetical protein ACK4K0_09500 [Flavobacteriales bacterium]